MVSTPFPLKVCPGSVLILGTGMVQPMLGFSLVFTLTVFLFLLKHQHTTIFLDVSQATGESLLWFTLSIFHLEMPHKNLSQTCSPLSFYHSQTNCATPQDILLPQAF